MLTREEIIECIEDTLHKHGMHLVRELNKSDQYSAGNLFALMEILAATLEAKGSSDIVGVIDAHMGIDWTRTLAEKLSRQPA